MNGLDWSDVISACSGGGNQLAEAHAAKLAAAREKVVEAAKRRLYAKEELARLSSLHYPPSINDPSVSARLVELEYADDATDAAVRALRELEGK